jgi:predicted phosphodiesterase
LGCDCIRGNHDPLDEAPAMPMLADIETWTQNALSAEDRDWLNTLPMDLEVDVDGASMLCVHGSPRSFTDNVLDSTPERTLRSWMGKRSFDVMVCGHTHVQLLRRMGRKSIVNVGSVGMPFEKAYDSSPPTVCPWAEYAIVGSRAGSLTVDLRRVAFDLQAYQATTRACGFPHADAWLSHWAEP